MGMKEIIARVLEKKSEKDEKFKEMEANYWMQHKLEEKQKSANERELERFMKEEREARIKQELEAYRKKQQNELWHNNFLLKPDENNILKSEHPILKEKDVIGLIGHSGRSKNNKMKKGRNLFFK